MLGSGLRWGIQLIPLQGLYKSRFALSLRSYSSLQRALTRSHPTTPVFKQGTEVSHYSRVGNGLSLNEAHFVAEGKPGTYGDGG